MDEIELDFDPALNGLLIRFNDLIHTKNMLVDSHSFSDDIKLALIDNVQKEIDRIVSDLQAARQYLDV